MKRHFLFLAAFVCLAACCDCTSGSWGPRGCASVEAFAVQQVPAGYRWYYHEGRNGEAFLYQGSNLIGIYTFHDGFYRPAMFGQQGSPARAPVPPPFTGPQGSPHGDIFGVETAKIAQQQTFSHNGYESTRDEVENAIGATLRDDSTGGHVSYVDADKARRQAIAKRVEDLRRGGKIPESTRFQAYDPNLKPTKEMLAVNKLDIDRQFRSTGHVLYAQAADKDGKGFSKVTTWYDHVADGEIIEACRKAAPGWVPDKMPMPLDFGLTDHPLAWIALIFAAAAILVGVAFSRK